MKSNKGIYLEYIKTYRDEIKTTTILFIAGLVYLLLALGGYLLDPHFTIIVDIFIKIPGLLILTTLTAYAIRLIFAAKTLNDVYKSYQIKLE